MDARSGGSDAEAEVVVDVDAEAVDPVVEFMDADAAVEVDRGSG